MNQTEVTLSEGHSDAPILFVSGVPSWEGKPFSDAAKSFLIDTAQKAGIRQSDLRFDCVLGEIPPGRKEFALGHDRTEFWREHTLNRLKGSKARVIVPLGNFALETITGHKSIDKWHLSIFPAKFVDNRKCIPLYHPEQIFANYKDVPFVLFGMQRLAEEMKDSSIKYLPRVFHTAPSFDQAVKFLINKCLFADALSIDIETAHGQITCVGFAPSQYEAMSIPTLPENWSKEQLYAIWQAICDVLKGPSKKIFQNFIYDCTYFSKYGLRVRNLWHDSMLAQKFLFPELPMGLDTIARLYTKEPYWKDEGKDWKNVQDLNQFWIYNCKDAAVTFEATLKQIIDLEARGLADKFYNELVMPLARPATEMCWRGLPINPEKRLEVKAKFEGEIENLNQEMGAHATAVLGKTFNSRSHVQVKEYIRAAGYRVPIKRGKETSDVTALLKLQQRYPDDKVLPLLISLSEKNKAVSSYLKPLPYPDNRFRFRLTLHGADTGRWSCGLDAWDNGFNAQTIPNFFKAMFEAPPGWVWLETDLRQADARFVAWDAPEPTLMKFFTEGRDIHRFVASRPELFNLPENEITNDQRQLGKKTGHAANYGMMGQTHADACLLEMGIILSARRAQQMLDGYHRTFSGIRLWQQKLRAEVQRTKKLTTPMGRERYFYDRLGDDLYRQAYAYRPQSTVSDVINRLIRHVEKYRNPEMIHHALQVHDSYLTLCREEYVGEALKIITAESDWNPKMSLAGGTLQIPIEMKAGVIWKDAKAIHG